MTSHYLYRAVQLANHTARTRQKFVLVVVKHLVRVFVKAFVRIQEKQQGAAPRVSLRVRTTVNLFARCLVNQRVKAPAKFLAKRVVRSVVKLGVSLPVRPGANLPAARLRARAVAKRLAN